MNRPSEPFTAEERDLAERLARLGGPREPAPALDARILAMARAAVAEPADASADASIADPGGDVQVDATPVAPVASDPAPGDPKVTPLKPRPRKPTQRWPLGLSLAASLVLAAGIGWKLHDNGAGIGEGTAETALAAAAEEDATQVIMVEPPLQREPPPPPPPMESSVMADASIAPAAPAAPPAPAAKPAPAREAPQNMVYAAEAAADAASPPAAMAAPAPVAQASEEAEQDSYDRIDVSGSRIRRTDREVGAAEYTRREQEARRRQAVAERAAGAAAPVAAPPPPAPPPPPTASARGNNGFVGDAAAKREVPKATSDYDDRPPVSADSPEFRQAWLQRIRELLAKGEQAWARESLREFKRRYPDADLPEDLKPLAATLTTP
jgi:resuscitation-promoting factor RpfA